MGKTLKRQRAKAAAVGAAPHQQQQQQKRHKQGAAAAAAAAAPSTASAWTAAVSAALERRRWDEACRLLDAMRRAGKAPKLGAIQRWVRDADASGDEAVAARVICGVLWAAAAADDGAAEAAAGEAGGGDGGAGGASAAAAAAAAAADPARRAAQQRQENEGQAAAGPAAGGAAVIRHAPWSPPEPEPRAAAAAGETPTPPLPKFRRIPRAPGAGGADSFAAGAAPVPICAFPPGSAVRWDEDDDDGDGGAARPSPVTRADVPFVPGAFVLVGALSARECREVLRAGRSLGFSREVDYAFGGGAAGVPAGPTEAAAAAAVDANPHPPSAARRAAAAAAGLDAAAAGPGGAGDAAASSSGRPAEGCVWLADASVLDPLWRRVRALLPPRLGGGPLAGLNSRWRLYRYTPGAVFRPHVDGAWPASGLDAEGRYLFDARGGEVWSRLTFLIYLNGAEDEDEEGEGAGAEENDGGKGGGGRRDENDDDDDDGGTFRGGATTFFSPALDGSVALHARGVRPRRGNVLVFPHGDASGALVHEGSAVTRGAKYVVRTEVLYELPPRDHRSGRRRPPPEAAAGLGRS